MLVSRQLSSKGASLGLRCLSVPAGEAKEALGHVEATEGRLDRNRVRFNLIKYTIHDTGLRMELRDSVLQ